jgi:hypothetical protein
LTACCEKRPAAAAYHAIFFPVRIDDRWRVANRTTKFLAH